MAGKYGREIEAAGVLGVWVPQGEAWPKATGDSFDGGYFDGWLVEDVLPAEGAERAYHWWIKALETGTTQRYQTEAPFPDGRRRVVDVTVFPWSDGRQVAGIIRDITSNADALERVQARDDLSRAVLDAIPTATAVLDRHGVIRMVNAAWVVDAADLDFSVALPGDDFVATSG